MTDGGGAAQGCHLPPAGFRGIYRSDATARALYSEAAGIGRIVPAAVAVPADADDVVTLVRWASDRSLPLVPRGSGTSMVNGAIGPGVIVDLSLMSAIEPVDIERRSVRAGPGALRGAVNSAAGARGLRFPVDPSSGNYCTVGGMAATNAAGAHSLRFGAMRPWVLSLDCVFDDGSRAIVSRGSSLPAGIPAIERFLSGAREKIVAMAGSSSIVHGGVSKDSSGYGVGAYAKSDELVDLLVGSEGTLALFVGVELALTDLPVTTSSILGAFASLDHAAAMAIVAVEAGAVACELLDRTFLDIASAGHAFPAVALADIPAGTEAVLLAQVEGDTEAIVASSADRLAAAFSAAGATFTRVAVGPAEQHEIWELRHAASPILARLDPALKSMQFIEDGAVPPDRLADYVRGVRTALDNRGVRGVIFGHAGDAHVHVNPLIDVTKPGWRDNVSELLDDVVTLTGNLGGTLSGEHGDGRLRAPLLPKVWARDAIRLFSLVKSAFDPRGILNPGVKVALPSQHPIGDIKYDPDLPPLPTEVRSALDRMTSEREYSKLRLSLIPQAG